MLTLSCYEYDLRDEEKCNANIYRFLLLGFTNFVWKSYTSCII